jgi:hypothetical protein
MGRHIRRNPLSSTGHPLRWRVAVGATIVAALLWAGVMISSLLEPTAAAVSRVPEPVQIGIDMTITPCACYHPLDFTYVLHGTISGHHLADAGVAIGDAVAYRSSDDLAYFERAELIPIGAPVHLLLSARDSSGRTYPTLARIDGTLPNCRCAALTLLLDAVTIPGQPGMLPRNGNMLVNDQGAAGVTSLQANGAALMLPRSLRLPASVPGWTTMVPSGAFLASVLILAALLATVVAAGSLGFELWARYAQASAFLAH